MVPEAKTLVPEVNRLLVGQDLVLPAAQEETIHTARLEVTPIKVITQHVTTPIIPLEPSQHLPVLTPLAAAVMEEGVHTVAAAVVAVAIVVEDHPEAEEDNTKHLYYTYVFVIHNHIGFF